MPARATTCLDVPGRICLFGDKVDLKGYPVIAATVNALLSVQVRPLDEPVVRMSSSNLGGVLEFPLGGPADMTHPLRYWVAVTRRLETRIGGFEAVMDSSIPVGSGLSSSAAVSVALVKGLNAAFDLGLGTMDIAEIAYRAEHDDLGIMCGRMDQYAIAFGGVTYIETGDPPSVTPLDIASLPVVVGDSQEERHASKVLNATKARLVAGDPVVLDAFDKMRDGVLAGRDALERGDFETAGAWMTRQQEQENRIDAATSRLNALCAASVAAGALGAKQMGAGGGGCMVALCPGRQAAVAAAIEAAGGKAWVFDVFRYV